MSLHFTGEHEWIRVEGDVGTVGISNHAQEALGDIVFAEVPAVGATLKKGGDAAVVESVKAASDILAPIDGEIVEVNPEQQKLKVLVDIFERQVPVELAFDQVAKV